MKRFDLAFEHILKVEGTQYTNHLADKGGPTKFGITLKAYQGSNPGANEESIKNLTVEQAKMFYVEHFWKPLKCDLLTDDRLALIIFDQGVNRGIGRIVKSIQKVLNLTVDGVFGPKTLTELTLCNANKVGLDIILDAQKSYIEIVKANPSQVIFLHGWLNRLNGLLKVLLEV